MIFESLDFWLGWLFGTIASAIFLVWYCNKLIKMGLMTLSFPILEAKIKALVNKAKGIEVVEKK